MSLERRRARCDVTHRRSFLVASAALGAALLLPAGVSAAQVKVLQGSVRVNGKKASKTTAIRPGDTVETAQGAHVAFVIGEDAFLLRSDSKFMLEHNASGKALVFSGLRLLSGGLLAVFGPGARRIETPTATAGIRGTGVYLEASAEQTYFCTCYGVVELRDRAGVERKTVVSGYHTANMIFANPAERGKMADAEVKDHTDEELIMLERLVGRTSPIVLRNQKLKEASTPELTDQPGPRRSEKPHRATCARREAGAWNKARRKKMHGRNSPRQTANRARNPRRKTSRPSRRRKLHAKRSRSPLRNLRARRAVNRRPSKVKVKPAPEEPPAAETTPMPDKVESPELGPSPTPPPPRRNRLLRNGDCRPRGWSKSPREL